MSDTASNLPLAESSDAVLISRIRAGEVSAYGTLYERHIGAARGLARQLADGDAAEDAVQETFAKILDVLGRGGGPRSGFRPYLLTAVRRTVYDRHRRERRLQSTDRMELYDPGVPFIDPALEGLERSMIVRAFQALPERWQAVLWHTEIEGARPADVAPLLGLSANGVAALAYRAREGLRQAYLQMHLADPPDAAAAGTGFGVGVAARAEAAGAGAGAEAVPPIDERCRPVLDMLGAYVRRGLSKRDSRTVERHLDDCERCTAIYAELADINTLLRDAVGPLILGTASAALLAAEEAAATGGALTWWQGLLLPKRQQQGLGLGLGAGAVAVAATVVLALVLVAGDEPLRPGPEPPPAAVSPPGASPKAPGARPQPRPQPPTAGSRAPEPPRPRPVPPAPEPPPPASPARLTASLGTVGVLLREEAGIVAMAVRNEGDGPSQELTADVGLPPDVTYPGGATGRNAVMFTPARPPGDGWTCRPSRPGTSPSPGTSTGTATSTGGGAGTTAGTSRGTGTGTSTGTGTGTGTSTGTTRGAGAGTDGGGNRVRCTHAPLEPGTTTTAYLHVQVGPSAPYKTPPTMTLRSGAARATAEAAVGIAAEGLSARFAADGRVRTVEAGNALLGCHERAPGCRRALDRKGPARDNDFWAMRPIDRDGDASTKNSSAARLPFPAGAKVLWAGLYWSGSVSPRHPDLLPGGAGRARVARVRPPGAERYETVRATEVEWVRLPGATGAYQAFAEVTALVRRHGTGTWWAGGVAHGGPLTAGPRAGHYAGWSLVAVVEDPRAPSRRAMVLDGARPLGPHAPSGLGIPLHGLLPSAPPDPGGQGARSPRSGMVRIGLVAWEGDAGLAGDRLLMDGRELVPAGGDGTPGNVLDGSAAGAIGPAMTFGTDIDDFSARLGRSRGLALVTRRDAVITGVVTVTAPSGG
ncbi:sigma-70 family RNA polymerase sigma factor [Spirillospora sp. CA-255316]